MPDVTRARVAQWWTGLSFVGLLIQLWALHDAWIDYRVADSGLEDDPHEIIGFMGLRNEAGRTLVQFVYLLMGVAVLVKSPRQKLMPIGMLVIEAKMVIAAILDRGVRERLIDIYEERG